MLKRIFVLILSLALTASMLLGCSFFSHDNERDMQQEIAVVNSYKIVSTVLNEEGEGREYEYKTAKKIIYKRDLLEYVQNNASSLSSSFSGNAEGLYNYAARMLISLELITNEVDALIASDQVEWGVDRQNDIRKQLYDIIDNTLLSLKNNILDERGQEQIASPSDSTDSDSTTYPVKPEQTDNSDDDGDHNKTEAEVWTPDRVMWPGINGDSDQRSLEREAMRRFIALIESRVKDDFRLDKPNYKWLKTKIKNEIKALEKLEDTQGIEAVYPVIGSYTYPMNEHDGEFGYILYYLSGRDLERSQKILAMQAHLNDIVDVKYDEVAQSYNNTLNEQRNKFESDISAYDSAMSGSDTVLYHANNNYFYVKHILLPFSDEQKDALTKFKNSAAIKNLPEKEKEARINAERARLAEAIDCYPHVNGEDDKTKRMSVDEVMEHVRSVMTPLAGNVKRANEAFNDLIYLYNTDPGAFGNDKGYVVKYKLDEGESETYMQEFADAAREMRETISVGSVYYEKVITDYGVHIMYLSSIPQQGAVDLNAYTTPDQSQTYYDLLEEPIRTARENAAYTEWQNNILTYNYNKYSKTYKEVFSDLWEK